MTSPLYNRDILRLAMGLVANDRLEQADGRAEVRSPTCGSRIEADVVITDAGGKISALAFRANACALGQASAAILLANAIGETMQQVADVRAGIQQSLSGEGDMPDVWPDLVKLAVAKNYPARHPAILLPYDALLAAMKESV